MDTQQLDLKKNIEKKKYSYRIVTKHGAMVRLSREKIDIKLNYEGVMLEGSIYPLGEKPVPDCYRVELNRYMYGDLRFLPNGDWLYPPGDEELTDLIIEYIIAWYQ